MSAKCAVFNCENHSASSSSRRSFFRFPKDEATKRKWIQFCGREKSFDPKGFAIVCIDHFTSDDFTNIMQFEMGLAARLRLKPDAFPTIKTKSSRNPKLQKQREERIQKRTYKKIVEKLLKEHDASIAAESENQQTVPEMNDTVEKETERLESDLPKINNFENNPMETTEILIERIPRVGFNEVEENPLEECEFEEDSSVNNASIKIENYLEDDFEKFHSDNYLESELERLHNDNYFEPEDERLHNEKLLESEVERLQKEVEYLQSENVRLQNAEEKYLKTLAAVKKKYLTTLETAHRKYLESEDKYLYEINTLKERLERAEYENYNIDNKLFEIHEA